jgi:hypothetical protein
VTRYGPGSGELELRNGAGEVVKTAEIATGPLTVGPSLILATNLDGEQVLLDHDLNTVGAAPWDADCLRAAWGPIGVQVAVQCGFGDNQRFEFWPDPLDLTEPLFTHAGDQYADLGFTTNGTPYVATVDSLRPSSTIIFFLPAQGQTYEVAYPGLVVWLASVRN